MSTAMMDELATDGPGDPTPKKKSVVLTLAEQANEAIAGGADPKRVSDRLGMMVQHIQSNPHLLLEADDALNKGADASALGERIYHLSLSGKAERDNAADAATLKDDQGVGQGAARAAFHGATLGFGDEITAGARAAFDKGEFSKSYNTELAGARTDLSNFRDTHPKTAIASELAGGLAPAALPGVRQLGAIKGGAAFGAVEGAGNADGGLGDRMLGAAGGTLAGAAGGAVLSKVVAPAARMGFDMSKAAIKPMLESETTKSIVDWMAAHPIGLSTQHVGGPTPFGGTAPPNATRGLGAQAARVIGDLGPQSADERARSLLLSKIGDDKQSLEMILDRAKASTKPNAIGDLSGENTLGLQRAAKTVPGEGKTEIPKRLYERQGGQQGRLVDDALELTGVRNRTNVPQTIADMGTARDAAAAESFGKLRNPDAPVPLPAAPSTPSDAPMSLRDALDAFRQRPAIAAARREGTVAQQSARGALERNDALASLSPSQQRVIASLDADPVTGAPRRVDGSAFAPVLKTPAGQQVMKQAERMALNERRSFAPVFDAKGNARPLAFDEVHNMKLAFDDLLSTNPSTPLESGGLGKNNARIIRDLKNQFVSTADQRFPGYADARNEFAEPSALMNAMNDGRGLFRMHPDEAKMSMDALSAPERKAFTRGALEAVADKIESGLSSHDRTRTILTTDVQKRLKLLFPDDQSFNQFIGRAEEEARMRHSLNFTMGGSNTVDKAAEVADLAGGASPWIQSMTRRGVIPGTVSALANSALANRASGVTTETANALTPMFTAGMGGNPQELKDLIQQLIEYKARDAARQATRNTAARPFTAAAGGAAGSVVSPPNNRR